MQRYQSTSTPAQRNWATIEREAYAVLVAVNKFKHWFFGSEVTIHSDHNPLTYLTESAPRSSKLLLWSLALAEFNMREVLGTGRRLVTLWGWKGDRWFRDALATRYILSGSSTYYSSKAYKRKMSTACMPSFGYGILFTGCRIVLRNHMIDVCL